MTLGLALFTPLALMGGVFYLVHHIIVKANLFFVAGLAQQAAGTPTSTASAGSTSPRRCWRRCSSSRRFRWPGFPPLSGFWAKYLIVKAAIELDALAHRLRRAFVGVADHLLDDQDLGHGVLEAAPGRDRPTPTACPRA
jgi:multicomponent Na+:H+ antiporter subunit D